MKTATHNIFGISKQRGFWLRCFLEHEAHSIQALRKDYAETGLVSEHDFSRAA
jgi:hypothetical protein